MFLTPFFWLLNAFVQYISSIYSYYERSGFGEYNFCMSNCHLTADVTFYALFGPFQVRNILEH